MDTKTCPRCLKVVEEGAHTCKPVSQVDTKRPEESFDLEALAKLPASQQVLVVGNALLRALHTAESARENWERIAIDGANDVLLLRARHTFLCKNIDFIRRIQGAPGDACWRFIPESGAFRYYLTLDALIDAEMPKSSHREEETT